MKAVGLAIALQVVAPVAYGQVAEPSSFKSTRPVSARHCPDDDAFSLERPDRDSGPTKVGVGVRINDIISLDDAQQSMQLDTYSVLRWRDPRLANSLRGEASVACPLPLDRMWVPHVQAINLRSQQELYEKITLVDAEGIVSVLRRRILEVGVPLDYREFPFDTQSLSISFSPVIFDENEIVFEALPGVTGGNDAFSLTGWDVSPPAIAITTKAYQRREGQESRISITMQARRKTGYWFYKLVIPLILIVLMSGSVFFLPPQSNRSQIAVAVTTMLTLIAYQFALASDLPRVSYLTRTDHLILGSSILVFGALIEATAVAVLLARRKEGWIALLSRIGRWVFGLAFLFILWFSLVR